MNTQALDELLEKHDLICAVAVSSDGSVVWESGNTRDARIDHLLSGLIGPYGDAKTTFASLEGQLLPRIWGQGDTSAFIHKPTENLMVITVGLRVGDTASNYAKSKAVDGDLLELLG